MSTLYAYADTYAGGYKLINQYNLLYLQIMKINEIFYSIQGEGKWTGIKNIFIRTTGCNLRCSFCDTTYAYTDGVDMTIEEIVNNISNYPCKYICITGGEPLFQNETLKLVEYLLREKYKVSIETNGSIKINQYIDKNSLMISLDIKCPSSKMHEKMCLDNLSMLRKNDQLKFIIRDKKDYNYAKEIFQKYKPVCPIYFQPVWGANATHLANWIIEDKLDVRLSLQIHKILWGNRRKS
jgi:7-carboxy-7-deazaguanine synthase